MVYADVMLKAWTEENRLRAPGMKNAPAFYRNLEASLDTRRQAHSMLGLKPRWDQSVLDFTTCDYLSQSRSGRVREAFLAELAANPGFDLCAAGSRLQYGNHDYLNKVEQEIADFHKAEVAHICPTGFGANVAVLSGVPLPGDAIVYDELVHASTHEGLHLSLAGYKLPFRHNNPDSLREVLAGLKKQQPAFVAGTRSILVCVESIYSMDGDVCPLRECVQVLKDEFPLGNAQLVLDEAMSVGVVGPRGSGLANLLGLEKEVAIRIMVASKAVGATGGIILCNNTIRSMLINHSRSMIFSGAPSFPFVASIRAGYSLLTSGESQEAQESIQRAVRHFFKTLEQNPTWERAVDEGLLSIPLLDGWEGREFQAHIVPLRTRTRHEQFVYFQLLLNNINAYPVAFPVVPKGQSRIRLVFHAHNTPDQVDRLVKVICDWAEEMLEIEEGKVESSIPSATRKVYAAQAALLEAQA